MSDLTFYIDIENSAGTRYGSGPITSAAQWQYTARMDKAGEFAFSLPATDANADQVQKKRIARAYALVGGEWTEVGAGIIDSIVRRPQADGTAMLDVSGSDLLRELTYRSVKDLKLTSGNDAITHAAALTAISAYAPADWTLTPAGSPGNDSIYGRYNGETVLAALIMLADKTETHFCRGSGRTVVFGGTFTSSGVRAIQAGPGDLTDATCAITSLTETLETYDLLTRIYPRGAGNGDVQLTLKAATRSAPSGYTHSIANNYIQHTAAYNTYGLIESYVEWRDIAPIENTSADIVAASNMLYDAAVKELERRATEIETPYYDLTLAQCSALLRPLQTMRIVYRDVDAGTDIDETLNILEATWAVNASGVQTTAVTVTPSDRWPQTDESAVADSIQQGRVYQALPQLNANEYTTSFQKNLDAHHTATFRFRFSNAVTALRWAFFEFQILPFEATVRSVGAETATSNASGDHTHSVTIADHTHSVTVADHTHSVTIADHTHEIPDHKHYFIVYPQSGSVNAVNLSTGGSGNGTLGHDSTYFSTQQNVYTTTTIDQSTTSDGGGTKVTSGDGGGTTVTSGDGGGTTVTSAAGGDHTHTVTPVIVTAYGVFREDAGGTYALSELEYNINGGAWADLSAAVTSLGSGWYRLDISDAIRNATTLKPTNDDNTIEIRGETTQDIDTIRWQAPDIIVIFPAMGVDGYIVGDEVTVAGTINYNGALTVLGVYDITIPYLICEMTAPILLPEENTGTVTMFKTAMIDAQLSIHSTIQPIYI